MMYFGLGCRNVSKLYLPAGYDLWKLGKFFEPWESHIRHNKYFNNYEYRKSIFIVNRKPFTDFGNLLLVEDMQLASPVAVLHYEYYSGKAELAAMLEGIEGEIQCVVSGADPGVPFITPGHSQLPELWDYADGVDTLDFLLKEI